jgi:hypothetical protein
MSERAWPDDTALLHILPQQEWHDPAFIVGTRLAIEALRNALTAALDAPQRGGRPAPVSAPAMARDGEGYRVVCRVVSAEDMAAVPFGYASETARDDRPWPRWLFDGCA